MSIGQWLRWYDRWTLDYVRGADLIEYPAEARLELLEHLDWLKRTC